MNYSIRQLRHAQLLAQTGSFTQAARMAHISQSALSRSIDKLEAQLDVCLFNRDGRVVTPTVYGEVVIGAAHDIDAHMEALQQKLEGIRGLVVGHLRIALGVYPAELSGYRAIGLMSKRYPQLSIKASVCNWQEVNQRVLCDQVDLAYAVIDPALDEARLEVEPVMGHEMAYYARRGHPLAGKQVVTGRELDAYPLISIRVPSGLAGSVYGKASVDRETGYLIPAIEIDDFSVARGVVRSSDAIGVTTPVQIEAELGRGEFVLLRYPRPWIAPRYGFIQKRGFDVSPAAEAFKGLIREAETELAVANKTLLESYLAP